MIVFFSAIYYGNKLVYLGVQINTTINMQTTGYQTGIPLIEKWESYINSEVQSIDYINVKVQLSPIHFLILGRGGPFFV